MTEQNQYIVQRDIELKLPKNSASLRDKANFYVGHDLTNAMTQESLNRIEPRESHSQRIAEQLSNRVFGQDEACRIVGRRVALAKSGLSNPRRPLASIFELGETGVGKTEMGHALAEVLFGDPYSDRLKIINMGEYMEHHDTKKILGAPQSYVGNEEESQIQHDWLHKVDPKTKEPLESIIIFDEMDKAHTSVNKMLLSIMDKGSIDARNGKKGIKPLDFTHTYLIFTSNVGANEIVEAKKGRSSIGFMTEDDQQKNIHTAGMKALRKHYKYMPEFVGRLSDIVVFNSLEHQHFEAIFTKMLDQKNKDLEKRFSVAPYISATQEFRQYALSLMDGGTGGRELENILDRELFDKASDVLIDLPSDVTLVAGYEDGSIVFYTDKSGDDGNSDNAIAL